MLEVPLYKVHMPPDVSSKLSDVLASGSIAAGPQVANFEKRFGEYLGTPWVASTGDISTSLTLSLYMAGVRPGDEVLMSPLVCLATSCPVSNLFATIRWCDVDPMTGNLDPDDLERRINPRTKAIVVYHWAGNPADLSGIYEVARAHDVPVIEDAGEALGATYGGKFIGTTGADFTVFSFYPNRHITTLEGGAITCAREADYEQLRWLKRYGIHQPSFRTADGEINVESDIAVAGWNSYMNHVSATLGVAQLAYLPKIVARHRANGTYYDQTLKGIPGLTVLQRPPNSDSAYWVYTLLAEDRDTVLKKLKSNGVGASKVHVRNDIYSCFHASEDRLPGVEAFSSQSLSIPSGWWVTDEERDRIVDLLTK